MRYTRYEIQAYTQVGWLDAAMDKASYEWIPLPRLMLSDLAQRERVEALREDNGQFRDLGDAESVYRLVKRERPGAVLRLRRIVTQEVYTTLDSDRIPVEPAPRVMEFVHAWPE